MQITLLLAIVVLWLLMKFHKKNSQYFAERNVKFPKVIPFFGFMFEVIVLRKHMKIVFQRFYNQFSSSRFFGVFEFIKPMYCIRDPELIRQISIKDFDHFVNHRSVFDENVDKLFGRSLFILRDQKWRDMRSTLSPAFTGSKMRKMFNLIVEISNDYMKQLMEKTKQFPQDVELKDLTHKYVIQLIKSFHFQLNLIIPTKRYAHDVIAKCAFGVTVNSLKDPENDYFRMGLYITAFPFSQQLKVFGYSSVPKLMTFMKVQIFNKIASEFFTDLVKGAVEYREKNNIKINDVISLLMEARKGGTIREDKDAKASDNDAGFATVQESDIRGNKVTSIKVFDKVLKFQLKILIIYFLEWDDDDMTAQCMLFFLAGFDTVSTAMMFMGYEIAINPEVQTILLQEIDDLLESLNGKLPSYEDIQKMEYLDCVVSESLRLWSPVLFLDRICTKALTIEDSDGTKVKIEVNDGVFFPINSLHMDPNYFPNPTKFEPERFSVANRDNIKPFTYLPFGVGPRNCIGSRFALMEIKALFFSILSHFRLEVSSKTEIPLQIKADTFQFRPKNGIWVQMKSRK
ncbi:unnamed protein product [Diamesa tonsa]